MQNSVAAHIMDMVIRKLKKKKITAALGQISQTKATITHAHFKVTTCLYLNPKRRAKSLLSTLIAVRVKRETPPKITPKILKSKER